MPHSHGEKGGSLSKFSDLIFQRFQHENSSILRSGDPHQSSHIGIEPPCWLRSIPPSLRQGVAMANIFRFFSIILCLLLGMHPVSAVDVIAILGQSNASNIRDEPYAAPPAAPDTHMLSSGQWVTPINNVITF